MIGRVNLQFRFRVACRSWSDQFCRLLRFEIDLPYRWHELDWNAMQSVLTRFFGRVLRPAIGQRGFCTSMWAIWLVCSTCYCSTMCHGYMSVVMLQGKEEDIKVTSKGCKQGEVGSDSRVTLLRFPSTSFRTPEYIALDSKEVGKFKLFCTHNDYSTLPGVGCVNVNSFSIRLCCLCTRKKVKKGLWTSSSCCKAVSESLQSRWCQCQSYNLPGSRSIQVQQHPSWRECLRLLNPSFSGIPFCFRKLRSRNPNDAERLNGLFFMV